MVEEITAYLNDDARLDEVASEQTKGTVLVDHGGPVLVTPCAAIGVAVATYALGKAIG
ncbi:hypothetical protein ABZ016_13725 [Streptomyces sp. NPDC006372]|uniref:hypothetical protein n=1 Tax=Streptomyces sp. NPDC006372 TaxID=3155599 RepID=UPI0033A1F69B